MLYISVKSDFRPSASKIELPTVLKTGSKIHSTKAKKNAATKVNGCVSQVWLVTERLGELLSYRGESDAMIVRGLAAILIALYSGRPAKEIADTDAIAVFDALGLREHLSTQRSNGLVAMVNRIRSEARALADA